PSPQRRTRRDAGRWPGCPAGSRWWWSRSRRTACHNRKAFRNRRAWGTSHTQWCKGRPDTRSPPP
ncbi:DUF951 domain-containing protein, partial [Dysosmobacter welbionis]